MQLASYRWACGSAGPNQSQTNETITELWVWHSVKNTIPKQVGNIVGSTHHLNDLITDNSPYLAPWNNMSVQQYLLINNKKDPDLR